MKEEVWIVCNHEASRGGLVSLVKRRTNYRVLSFYRLSPVLRILRNSKFRKQIRNKNFVVVLDENTKAWHSNNADKDIDEALYEFGGRSGIYGLCRWWIETNLFNFHHSEWPYRGRQEDRLIAGINLLMKDRRTEVVEWYPGSRNG